MDILCEIQKSYNNLSDKEKDIADYIINQDESINNISIKNLADRIGTSSSTITRFARKIGCESFVDLKIKLNNLQNNSRDENEDSILTDVYNYYSEVVERNKYLIKKEDIDRVIKKIKGAKRIHVYGVGSSGLSAIEMMQRL